MLRPLGRYLIGWRTYFGFCQTPARLEGLDSWLRCRLRSVLWTQWKRYGRRVAELRRRGVGRDWAVKTACSAHGPWRLSHNQTVCQALPNAYFDALGLPRLAPWLCLIRRTAVYGSVRTVVWQGWAGDRSPYAASSQWIPACAGMTHLRVIFRRAAGGPEWNEGKISVVR